MFYSPTNFEKFLFYFVVLFLIFLRLYRNCLHVLQAFIQCVVFFQKKKQNSLWGECNTKRRKSYRGGDSIICTKVTTCVCLIKKKLQHTTKHKIMLPLFPPIHRLFLFYAKKIFAFFQLGKISEIAATIITTTLLPTTATTSRKNIITTSK